MKKKITALLLALATLVALLTSCSEKYPAVESTEEEARVLMTLSFGDERYEVKYELYRALFLNLKEEFDGGDESVWSGDKKDEYIDGINAAVLARITEIYSVFSIAKEIGLDVYSKEYNKSVQAFIEASVEGGMYNGVEYTGFEGDYEKYLASLKKMNLNYSVQDLMLRYALALDDIEYYFGGNVENDATLGHLEYTRADVERFYESDECVRVLSLFLSTTTASFTRERAEEIRARLEALAPNDGNVFAYMIQHSTLSESDLRSGTLIGRYSLDETYYGELTREALDLAVGEVSPVIEVVTGYNDGYFILYRIEKSEEHFEESYDDVRSAYVEAEIGKMLSDRAEALRAGLSTTEAFSALVHADIAMP